MRAVCTTRRQGRVARRSASPCDQPIEQLGGQPLQLSARSCGAARVEVVEDVVGVPGEAVQRVHGGPLLGRQQPGGQEERPAVRALISRQRRYAVAQRRVAHAGGVELRTDHVCTSRVGAAASTGRR